MVMLGSHPCQGPEVRVKQSAILWSFKLDVFQRDNSLITETTTCNLATEQGELSYTPDRRICMNDSNQVKYQVNGAVVDHLSQGRGRRKRSSWPRPEEEFESSRGTS